MDPSGLNVEQGLADAGLLGMIQQAGPVVQAVLVLLVFLSIASWTITIAKILYFRRANQSSNEFRQIFWETRDLARIDDSSRRLAASPLAAVFESGYREFSRTQSRATKAGARLGANDAVGRALKRAELEEALRLEKGNTFLASVASSAPFIGLFGTVWGIMNAFHGLGRGGQTTLQAVAPGISEALVATAVGLAAAIPAAIAYNYFAVGVRRFREAMSEFSDDFLSLAGEEGVEGVENDDPMRAFAE